MIKTRMWMMMLAAGVLSSVGGARAIASVPSCVDKTGQAVPIDNDQVLTWKATTANQTLERAHVQGTITALYPDKNGHQHFEITIGTAKADTIEIVSNIDFGDIPNLEPGETVEACGDYITSTAATTQYPASPDGAIIHWVHLNPKGHGHPSGFTVVDGVVYGQGKS